MSNKINEYFLNTYLTTGGVRGKFVFKNCPQWFLEFVNTQFKKRNASSIAHVVTITGEMANKLSVARDKMTSPYQKQVVARNYVNTLVMKALLEGYNASGVYDYTIGYLDYGIESMLGESKEDLFHYMKTCPITSDVQKFMRMNPDSEVVFILEKMNDCGVGQAINNYLSAGGMNVKVFTSGELASAVNEAHILVESPHDYQNIYYQNFIENEDGGEMI